MEVELEKCPVLEPYDFNDTLWRLENIASWLNTLGFTTPDRVRIYSRNIRKMIEVEASGGMEALQATIHLTKPAKVFGATSMPMNSCGQSVRLEIVSVTNWQRPPSKRR